MSEIIVQKNEEEEGLIPHVWRPIFEKIIKAFVEKYRHVASCSHRLFSNDHNFRDLVFYTVC